jgi:hypothetical protein
VKRGWFTSISQNFVDCYFINAIVDITLKHIITKIIQAKPDAAMRVSLDYIKEVVVMKHTWLNPSNH